MNENRCIIYSATDLSTDDKVIAMIMSKPTFPINTIIELCVTFTRLEYEILRLLHRIPHCSSLDVKEKQRTRIILYFCGHLKWATILECPYGHCLMFRSKAAVYMSISHDYTFVHLLDKILHGIGCEDKKEVTEVSYRRAIKVVNNCLFHDIVEIKCDRDVVQMI